MRTSGTGNGQSCVAHRQGRPVGVGRVLIDLQVFACGAGELRPAVLICSGVARFHDVLAARAEQLEKRRRVVAGGSVNRGLGRLFGSCEGLLTGLRRRMQRRGDSEGGD